MGAVDPEEWRDSDLTWMRSEPAFERLRRGDPMRGTHPEPGVSYKDFNIPKPGEPWIEGLHDMSLLDEPYHMNPWGGMEKLNAAEPNYEDPLYPFKGWSQGEPEDTTDLDNLQPGDDAYHDFSPDARPTHPLLKDVNRILDEGSEEGSDALASGLNTIFKSQEGTEGLPLEERKRRGEKAIDEYVKGLKGTHAEKVKALRADWDARGGRKTGEPVPVARFSPRHKHPDGQYIVPMDGNPFPQSQSVIRYQGDCKGCGRSTFMDDAGDFSDPRGPIGDYTSNPMHAHEFDMHGPSIPACFNCQNDYEQYKKLESKGMGHKAGDPTGGFHWTWQRQPDGSQKNVRIDHTHAKDKKGIWHAPGEKPGLCTDCGPMKAEAAWADFLRADVD